MITEENLAQIESLTAKAKRSTDLQKYRDAEWFLLVAIDNIPAIAAALREAWKTAANDAALAKVYGEKAERLERERDAATARAENAETMIGLSRDLYERLAAEHEAERDALRAEAEALRAALDAIFRVGDGYGPNTEEKPCGTTGEGHAQCRQIASAALQPSKKGTGE